jgi:hypothetical protein
MINGANAILYSDYSDVAALQAEGIEIARPISDQSWGLLAAITLPAGLRSASPAPPPDRGPADLSSSAARQENWRTLASSPGHRPATLPLWLGGRDLSRPNRRPSGMGGRRESGPSCQGGTRLHQPEPSAEPIWPAAPVAVTVASPMAHLPVRS